MSRAERIALTERHITRQVRIARSAWATDQNPWIAQPHRLAKRKFMNCGNPRCVMCQNPRKRGELTMQEKRLMQRADDGDIGFQISEQDQ